MTWRPARPSRADRDPEGLERSLRGIAADLGTASPALLRQVFARWEEVVGPDVAAHATPVSVRDGILRVVVDHPAWATSLRMLSGQVIERLSDLDAAPPGGPRQVTGLAVSSGSPGIPRRARPDRPG